jgi:predicted RNase H-like nuclease (RuvC/YqgF family)
MNKPIDERVWWQLHVRKARGETLTEQEEQCYAAEVARQDREAVPIQNLEDLKTLREQTRALTAENRDLRERVQELEAEIRRVEGSLSRETRTALGIAE